MRLIIADGEEVFREGVKSVLDGLARVEVVGEVDDGAALLELLESVTADVVVLGIGMAEGLSLQVVERLRELVPGMRVVVVTADHNHVREAIESGVDACLLRRAAVHEFAAALRLVSDGHSYIQAELVNSLGDPSAAPVGWLYNRRSPEQRRILQLVTEGLKNKQIARELGISETTVKSHLRMIYAQLNASSRVEAVAAALRLGIVE